MHVLILLTDYVLHFVMLVACHPLSAIVDFLRLLYTYWFLFWDDRWYLLSTCALYSFLLVNFCFLLWSTRVFQRLRLALSFRQSLAYHVLGELFLLDHVGSPQSCEGVLVFTHNYFIHRFWCFDTLKLNISRLNNILDMMIFRFWEWYAVDSSVLFIYYFNKIWASMVLSYLISWITNIN